MLNEWQHEGRYELTPVEQGKGSFGSDYLKPTEDFCVKPQTCSPPAPIRSCRPVKDLRPFWLKWGQRWGRMIRAIVRPCLCLWMVTWNILYPGLCYQAGFVYRGEAIRLHRDNKAALEVVCEREKEPLKRMEKNMRNSVTIWITLRVFSRS